MLKVGDVVKLRKKYRSGYMFGLIVRINSSSFPGEGGWVSFDYTIMTETGMVLHITEGCVEQVYSTLK
tara:strand:- start:27 stop:230 length:204 start_codon:yes stop_codon:yes gene_type:complete